MQIAPLKYLKRINWRLAFAGLCAIGVLHLIAVLTEPLITTSKAYARLEPDLPVNRMLVMPLVTPDNQMLPFLSPDARYAMCRFSTANGPVAVTAPLLGPGWVLSVYSKEGESLSTTIAAPERQRTDVVLRLTPSDERFMGLTPQARGLTEQYASALSVAAQSGVVVVSAPDRGKPYREIHEAALVQASCRQIKSREPNT